MVEFFTTLGAIVVLAAASLAPGYVGGTVARELADQFPGARPEVRIEADPLLQLPFGHLAKVEVGLDGLELGPIAIPEVDFEVRDMRIPPAAIWRRAAPTLLAPAPALMRLGGSAEAWRAALAKALSGGRIAELPLPRTPLGPLAGKVADPAAVDLTFEPGRIGVKLALPGKGGTRLPMAFSFKPTIAADGRKLMMGEPRAWLGDKEMPAPLLRIATGAPLLSLDSREIPGRDWRFTRFEVTEAGLWVEFRGVLERLPGEPEAPEAP